MHPLLTRFAPLAVIALAGTVFAGLAAWKTVAPPTAQLPGPSRESPWAQRISASGLIEGDGEEIRIGSPEAALVSEVMARIGQRVKAGDILFRLDGRLAAAEVNVAEAELAAARAGLALAEARASRIAALPRNEDAAPAQARLQIAEARLTDAKIHRKRIEALWATKGTHPSQVDVQRGLERIALAERDHALAELDHARLGAWDPDVSVAGAEVSTARASVATREARLRAALVRLERMEVRAPRDATVVDVGITAGAHASPEDPRLVVLSDLSRMMVRVEVHESQAWRVRPGAAGRGWVGGDPAHMADLVFERIDPKATSRRAIVGQPGERLDGRVLNVLYRVVDPPASFHPGYLLEVELDSSLEGSR